ncbi:MAG: hypothetical protein JO043_01740 [Candidatus Eremiobacteraeota bacterium]|nr:hypothetical protein [Candidatus Eremiobacteraeota bacterium]
MFLTSGSRAFARVLAQVLAVACCASSIAQPATARMPSNSLVGGPPWGPALLPTGQYITPLVARGARFQRIRTGLRPDTNADANGAIASALSPDGKTLLVLTSGYNAYFYTTGGTAIVTPYIDPTTGKPATQTTPQFQWIFVYDVSRGEPRVSQQIQLPNAYNGLAWDPSGLRFYVSGGQDDRIYIFAKSSSQWAIDAPLPVLAHNSNDNTATPTYDGGILKFTPAGSSQLVQSLGLNFGAMTAGVAVAPDGSALYAANLQDDSVSIVDPVQRKVTQEIALFRPGARAKAVGEFPYWITPHSKLPGGPPDKVYVTSVRDGQILVLRPPAKGFKVLTVGGEPSRMLLSADGARLYVVNPDLDEVEVVNTQNDTVAGKISLIRPGYRYRGVSPNSLALSPDGLRLYVTCGNENSVAVIDASSGKVLGRIPTAWQPSSVTVSADGSRLYILSTKAEAGPSPTLSYNPKTGKSNYPNPTYLDQYVYDTEKSTIETLPVPSTQELSYLSGVVDVNNGFPGQRTDGMMAFLRRHIKHIIYIQKENRTYDQLLGDLGTGNGDPRLTMFPQKITPNFHQLASQFVNLDNWYMSSDVSGDGWNWAEQGTANDYTNKSVPVSYAGGGFDFEWNGTVRNQNVNLPVFSSRPSATTERMTQLADPTGSSNIEPGTKDIAATWGADDDRPGQTGGYIWDSVLRAGLSYRHYGLYVDQTYYSAPSNPYTIPIVRYAWRTKAVQGAPARPAITPYTDPYFRGWDTNTPDEYRFEAWDHEFQNYIRNRNFPAFETVLFNMDHMGNFNTNVGGLANPDTQQASNDHAVGELVDAVSHSPYWSSTAIFVLEDDSQDGPDHVDAHRSTAYVISPWVRHGALVHTMYTDANMLATIEDILGIDHLGMNDANAAPMSDVFTTTPNTAPYSVIIPGVLCRPPVHADLVPQCRDSRARKTEPVPSLEPPSWWRDHTHRFSWSAPDQNDPVAFNRLVWKGTIGGNVPYPAERTREDLSTNRAHILATYDVPGTGR